MASEEPIFDSSQGWVKSHIREYVESDGQKGALWQGHPALLLITRGRKSGKLRRTALFYGRDGANYLIVASNGGAPKHPAWYLNLSENPEVELQVGSEKFAARARKATVEEKLRLGPAMKRIFPLYDRFQAKTGREIPLVILEPV
jgi:deazaflavin-dependent oxidoreductase (nitroreductase family)